MNQFADEHAPAPMTPPQHGGPVPTQPASWPTVLGVILIVFASLGLLSNFCGALSAFVVPAMMGLAGDAANDPMIKAQADITDRYMIFYVINGLILVGLGILLLMAGIGLLRRRRSAPTKIRIWAIGRIIWSVPAAYLTYVIAEETIRVMEKAAADSGQTTPAGMAALMHSIGPIGAAVNFVLWCAMPVFVLIWFALPKIRAEVARWG